MCGILGYVAIKANLIEECKFSSALELMAHRGPDNHGVLAVDDILLGHRRLSIIDISSNSNMPFRDEDNNLAITYNGEIYNYIEIRQLLIDKGYSFKTNSDTEVILKAYEEWGESCLKKFNGMFAFFIYDSIKKKGFGARDRFGVKPLYFHSAEDKFIFSSEVKPILALGVNATPNREYIRSYIVDSALDYGSCTLIEEIKQIEPGQYFVLENDDISFTQWWSNDDLIVDLPDSYEERIELYRSTLADSVKIRLRSDVNSAITLSGGMDSTSIYSLYKKSEQDGNNAVKPLDVFTIKYGDESGIDEVDDVKKITSSFGDSFNSIQIDNSKAISKLRETIYFQEFPAWNVSPIAFQDIYKSIKNSGSTVLLEGHGNDEILGGYNGHINLSVNYFLKRFQFRNAWNAAKTFSQMNNVSIGQKAISPIVSILYGATPLIRNYRRKKTLEKFKNLNLWHKSLNLDHLKRNRNKMFTGFQNELLHLVNSQILPTVLRVFDRATMSSSIEMRAPFMDYRLVQISFSLRDNEKIGGGYQKRILRDAMKGLVPESIRTNIVKKGFSGDLITWFNHPNNYDAIKAIIKKINPEMLLNKEEVDIYFESNYSKGFKWEEANVLSRILAFIVWWELYIDGQYSSFKRPKYCE